MKKKLLIILLLFISIFVLSCNKDENNHDNDLDIKTTYDGKEISKINYSTIDYNGGVRKYYVIDFENNEYLSSGYTMLDEEKELKKKRDFTEEEEVTFINGIYSNGLLGIKEEYKATGILDGGGWNLEIIYEDGEKKTSTGDNDAPEKVFNSCSTYFYDLCKEQVLGNLPPYYTTPPQIDVFFNSENYSSNGLTRVYTMSYKWNNNLFEENNIYELCKSNKTEFDGSRKFKVGFYTANYKYEKRFAKFILTICDNNEELSNETIVSESKWFKQIEFDLEYDKIYVFELQYANGDFVKYCFSTEVN